MSSSFSSLNAALTGLYASQRLVEVSGHNIENMNTPGYTRQRISQKALGISSTPSIFAGSVPQGGGVEMERLQRMGDIFLDAKLRLETGRAASTSEVSKSWNNIESAMDEMGKMSITKTLGEFYKSWGDVNNGSDNAGARSTVLGRATALTEQIKTGYTRIADLWKDSRNRVDALVADVNTTMDSVAALNERIRREKTAGADVNELIDQRAQLVLKLSQLTGATGREREDGTIEVMLAGNSMVDKNSTNHFVVRGSADMPGIDAAPRETYTAAIKALGGGDLAAGKTRLTDTIPVNQVDVQRYQSRVEIDATTGKEFIAFYDMSTGGKGTKLDGNHDIGAGVKPNTVKTFELKDFQHDEGPVRLIWQSGNHQVVIDEGTLGGLMKNLSPAARPYVPDTVGKGGSYAETGKLYNDLAERIAKEVNTLHAADGTRTLQTEKATFLITDPSEPAKLTRNDGENDTSLQQRADDKLSDLQTKFPNADYEVERTGDLTEGFTFKVTAKVSVPYGQSDTDTTFQQEVDAQIESLRSQNPGMVVISQTHKKEGGDFFKFDAADNKLPPAMRLQVAIDNPYAIAAGKEVNGIYDGSVAYSLAKAQDNPDSASNRWANSVVDIGVHTKGAQDRSSLAEQTRRIADRAHKSATGVEMNEEVVNLIQGQHAYAGAARVMSTVNQMLDDLINLGRR